MALRITFAAQDPPDGPLVATKRQGLSAVHLVDGEHEPLCGAPSQNMAVGALRKGYDDDHSDLCTRCQKIASD